VIAASLRWLVDPSGPLWIRPSPSPALLDWIARFMLSCRPPAYTRALAALQQAAARAAPAFEALAGRGVEFERHHEPLLFPAFDQAELDVLTQAIGDLHRAGSSQRLERVSAEELRALEPALGPDVVGGMVAHGEGRVRPESLTAALKRALLGRGVEVIEGLTVTRLAREDRDWLAETPTGPRRAQAVLVAGGVDSARLLAGHGIRLPIAAAKGYSRTYTRHLSGPQQPLYLEGPKVAISVYEEGVRVSGTLELGARSLSLSPRRLEAITAAAQKALPGWQMPPEPRDWAGMRSLSPDGLPYIGPVPDLPGVHLATGHATLGITLAPLTGELVAAMLLDGARDELLSAFDPARAI
jgi:D-amino-acid dehydrogenase